MAKWVDATSPVTVTVRVCFDDGAVSRQDSWGAPTFKEEGERIAADEEHEFSLVLEMRRLLLYRARLASLRLSYFPLLKRSLATGQICTAPVCRDDVPHIMWIVSSLSRRPLGLHRSCMLCFSWRYECIVSQLEASLTSKYAVVCHGNDGGWVWALFRTHRPIP